MGLKYNNKNQAYFTIGDFSIKSNNNIDNYVRVRFTNTGHEQVVKSDLEKLGQFEDESLTNDKEEVKNQPFKVGTLDTIITAISPDNKEQDIPSGELEDFSLNNKLDYDAVQLVLNGHQKTHRRWQFIKKTLS